MKPKFAAVNSAIHPPHLFPRSSQEPPSSSLEALCLFRATNPGFLYFWRRKDKNQTSTENERDRV